jgi:hypothetical protein
VRRALYPHGLLLDTYASLDEFCSRPAHHPILGALLDVDLGDGVHGTDVAREVRARCPEAQIAFITAEVSPERVEQLRAYGTVFDKTLDLDRAVTWLIDIAKRAEAKAGEST